MLNSLQAMLRGGAGAHTLRGRRRSHFLNIARSAGPQRKSRALDVQILNVPENFQKSDSHRILGGVVKTLSNFEIV